jgi:hypothetical protein
MSLVALGVARDVAQAGLSFSLSTECPSAPQYVSMMESLFQHDKVAAEVEESCGN